MSRLALLGAGGPNWKGLFQVITDLGLTTGLKLSLDAADTASYPGTGQSWLDRSGGGYDYFLGATVTATTDDPTFNGTAGEKDANWSFDGGDFFRYDTTNETWMNNYHKNNAALTMLFYINVPSYNFRLMHTGSTVSVVGVGVNLNSSGFIVFLAANGSGTIALNAPTSTSVPTSQWVLIGVTVDEAGATGFTTFNGVSQAMGSAYGAYSSPSASAATNTMDLMGAAGGSIAPSGSRLAAVAMWEGTGAVLTVANHLAIYNALAQRGLS